jgi:Glycosyl transferase family 4
MSGWAVANLVVAAASMGFLVHNWPPARIFMGDFILDTTFTLFRRLIRREQWYQAHRSHFYQRMTDLGMTLHPGRSCGADRFGGFRDRGDRLRRSLGTGQGKTAEQGRSCELPLNRDRPEPIAPDELRSSCAKAPFPGAFALSAPPARYMPPTDGNHFQALPAP